MDSLPRYGLVRRGWIERLLDGKLRGHRPRRGVKIWLLVTLESWLRTVVGGEATLRAP
jgi:asparagine synthase (glutamine-hydrolysing)